MGEKKPAFPYSQSNYKNLGTNSNSDEKPVQTPSKLIKINYTMVI